MKKVAWLQQKKASIERNVPFTCFHAIQIHLTHFLYHLKIHCPYCEVWLCSVRLADWSPQKADDDVNFSILTLKYGFPTTKVWMPQARIRKNGKGKEPWLLLRFLSMGG